MSSMYVHKQIYIYIYIHILHIYKLLQTNHRQLGDVPSLPPRGQGACHGQHPLPHPGATPAGEDS